MTDEADRSATTTSLISRSVSRRRGKRQEPARKPRHKREMPETDEPRQLGCEMRDAATPPGLYLISGIGVYLSQLFEVIARCDDGRARRDRRSERRLYRLSARRADDVKLFLSNDILFGDRNRLAKALSEAKFSFDPGDTQLRCLRRYLSDYSCRPPRWAIVVGRAGWIERHDELIGFMLPSGMIPENRDGETPYILDPLASTARYVSRGTIEDFKNGAARLAGLHTLGRFRMASAFVGPLLKFADQEGGGWHLFGPSSDIKSILDLLAMMIWGRGVRGGGFGRKWHGTANGIEGIAAAHNDTALFLDDTSNADATDIAADRLHAGRRRGEDPHECRHQRSRNSAAPREPAFKRRERPP